MSDDSFIREVEEELRNEQLKNLWAKYGTYIIVAAVLVVVGVAGYRYYDYSTTQQAQANGDAFMEAVQLADEDKTQEAIEALDRIENDGSQTYQLMARLRAAAEHGEAGRKDKALELYDAVANESGADENLRTVARLRAAMTLVDIGSVSDVEERLGTLTAPNSAFRGTAREALGLAHFRAGDLKAAFEQFDAIDKDAESPSNLKQRTRIMLEIIASRGGPKQGS